MVEGERPVTKSLPTAERPPIMTLNEVSAPVRKVASAGSETAGTGTARARPGRCTIWANVPDCGAGRARAESAALVLPDRFISSSRVSSHVSGALLEYRCDVTACGQESHRPHVARFPPWKSNHQVHQVGLLTTGARGSLGVAWP